MGRVVVLGESLVPSPGSRSAARSRSAADDPESVRRCWEALPDDTAVVILTPAAAAALGTRPQAGRLSSR